MSPPSSGKVHDEPARGRYVLEEEGGTAIAAYAPDGDVLVFTHTEVPEALQGHGIGSRLVAGMLDDVRARGLRIVPQCPFVAAFVAAHPEYGDLVAG